MNVTHLKCPKCGGEFQEPSIVKQPGMNTTVTVRYDEWEMRALQGNMRC